MNKIIYITAILILSATSCNKWLTVTPKGQVEASKLLTSEQGYNSAMGGIYFSLSDKTLYGKEMSYGTMDALAQYWHNVAANNKHDYVNFVTYSYENSNCVNRFNSFWKEYYSGITQCNLILESLKVNKNSIKYSELFEGEALALRAFLHLELFKLFGPLIKTKADLSKSAIAYRREYNVIAQKFNTSEEVLNFAKEDLLKAAELMKNDPIKTVGRKGDLNSSLLGYNNIINRRGARMNYFGALSLLARAEQYLLNPDGAFTYAKRVIDETKEAKILSLIDKSNIEGESLFKDLIYSGEMIFGLYINNLYEMTDLAFLMNKKGGSSSSFIFDVAFKESLINDLYGRAPDGAGNDNRLRYWFDDKLSESGVYEFKKMQKAPSGNTLGLAYDSEIGVIRICEIYYIACEALIGKDNALALQYLNEVRFTRNLENIVSTAENPITDESLKEYLLRDMRKEYIGEGHMFSVYKRMFAPIYVKKGLTIEPLEKNFVLPIPDAEYEFSPNEKPVTGK